MPQKTVDIANGAQALFIESEKFNTTLISFNFYLPLNPSRVAEFALLPFVLTTCGKNYPDFRRLNFTLNKLYGANLFASAEKVGDIELLKIGISVINDKFALDGENITEKATELLFDLLFNPKAQNGEFSELDTEREKRRAIEHIKGEMSEKRVWARERLIEEMFKGDVYGTPKCGSIEQVEAITPSALYLAWEEMLKCAFIRVNVIGKKQSDALLLKLKESFSALDRTNAVSALKSGAAQKTESPKTVTDYMDVAQGKLCMGFTCDICGGDKSTAALTVMCDLFGGGPYSRLFTIVREKMSLCYYCGAQPIKVKGALYVSSGIEPKNAERAKNAILDQMDVMKRGQFKDSELEASKRSITDSLMTYEDSQGATDAWYSIKIENEDVYSPREVAQFISAVTRDEVEKAAQKVKLHTVYKLLPKE